MTSAANQHTYTTTTRWTGNDGSGTSSYRAYRRDHDVVAGGKAPIACSSDPAFRGDRTRYNPEELLVASLSACHMLWYLHLCAVSGVVVTGYVDTASGTMDESTDGSGQFSSVVLRPAVRIAAGSDAGAAAELHHKAHEMCFIARSVNFPVRCEPEVRVDA